MKTFIFAPEHKYEMDLKTGEVKDCFGVEMHGIDCFIEELNFLMGELTKAKEAYEELFKTKP
jgi:hypothetical protein